ncbi:MAG: ligase-associated DNA damage response DEXH box helicase [Anaerolineae bacterium]|nr:ligase-associated DNA damage response DEXH box helicase [Anaerolineae bacterium]
MHQELLTSNTVLDWFSAKGWTPFPFQHEVWSAYLNGDSGLIHAPTGTGKTYAAWLGPLMEWVRDNPPPYDSVKRKNSEPLRVLWITPLRALAADTAAALTAPILDLNLPWSVETRTGDTSMTVRNRQRSRLPSALITTPESLSLLLTRPDCADLFKSLRAVIVDEWHELMASKRGVQVELGLARLRRFAPGLRVWGLSATIGNLDTALHVLMGEGGQGKLIRAHVPKQIQIDTLIPAQIERFPWVGHIGLKLLPDVIREIDQHQSVLIFTNTRAQTETWYQAILDARPEFAGVIALHHSSLEPEVRHWVENALKAGQLRCVVCTASLDLGVDFAPVERVFQIGSPKGIARLLQRAGRSGHRPGVASRITCVPAHAFELVEVAAVRDAAAHGEIEARPPLDRPLDVLVQHLVTVALGGGFESAELYVEVRTTHAFRDLMPREWDWCLQFVVSGGEALSNYPQYQRVIQRDGRYVAEDTFLARWHRLSIGTITSDPMLLVQYLRGPKIGYIDEAFVARLKSGDKFTLAGKVLQFVRLREMKVWVRRAKNGKGIVPRWTGGLLPISELLTDAIRVKLDEARTGKFDSPEMLAVKPILDLQDRLSYLPAAHELLIEQLTTREGHHLFLYPFEGRIVHEGLGSLLAHRLSRRAPITFTIAANDYGLELLATDPLDLQAALAEGLLSTEHLQQDILSSLNATEMAKRQFRELARVSGLVIERFPGGQKSSKQMQASSGLIYDVLAKYDPDNLLLEQAQREVLQRQLESSRLFRALGRLHPANIVLRQIARPTPFGFPLMVERLRQTVSSETLEDRIRKMQLSLEKWADEHG